MSNPTCHIITPALITPDAALELVRAVLGIELDQPSPGGASTWALPLGYELTYSVAPWGAEIWQSRRGGRRAATRTHRNMQDLDSLLMSIRAELRRSRAAA